MTGKALWQSIKALVSCDQNIGKTEADITTIQKNIQTSQLQIEQLKKQLENNRLRLVQDQKNIDFYELQAQSLHDTEEQKRKQLDNIKSQKEYKALEKEIELVSTQRKDLDDLMLRTYHQVDLEKNKIAKEQEQFEQKIAQLTIDIENQKNNLSTLEEQLIKAKAERKEAAEAIPTEWIARYERMRHNVADPIVPVINGCCSACFYAALHQDMAKLKKSGLLLCRNCYRFLYYDEEEEQDTQKASY